jgi:hypothetical protein
MLVICLAGLSAHFLADNLEHFMWESAADSYSADANHSDHQDENSLLSGQEHVDDVASIRPSLMEGCLFRHLPSISPLLPPPKAFSIA